MNAKTFRKTYRTSRYYTARNLSVSDPDRSDTRLGSLGGVGRIVFLDIDGVLNSSATYWRYKMTAQSDAFTGVDRHLVDKLNRVVDAFHDVRFVLSSSWRVTYYDTLAYLSHQGFRGRFIGKTAIPDYHRGDDISDWVRKHDFKGNWVAIDDDTDCAVLGDHWVQTHDGLDDTHVDAILTIMR